VKTPPQSPDLNPIEHWWAYLKKKGWNKEPQNQRRFEEVYSGGMGKITNRICKKPYFVDATSAKSCDRSKWWAHQILNAITNLTI